VLFDRRRCPLCQCTETRDRNKSELVIYSIS
jgi:hypothetical protein